MAEELSEIRKHIDLIDERIANLLQQRFFLVEKIGKIKKEHYLPISNLERETQIIERISKATNLDREIIDDVYKAIFTHSKRLQKI